MKQLYPHQRDAVDIRNIAKNNPSLKQQEIGNMFVVDRRLIGKILSGKTYNFKTTRE